MGKKAAGILKVINIHATRLADREQCTTSAYAKAFENFVDVVNNKWLQEPELEDPSSRLGAAYWAFWRADDVQEKGKSGSSS